MFIYLGRKHVLLLCDSMAKYVEDVDCLSVQPFPGRTIGGLVREVSCNTDLQGKLSKADYVIIHVGTNDIHKLLPEEFSSNLNNLVSALGRVNRLLKPLISAIIPRPLDYKYTRDKVVKANNRIKYFCKLRKIPFLKTFRPFLGKNGHPLRHLFAIRDGGLHLNSEGSRVLSNYFLQVVKGLRKAQ